MAALFRIRYCHMTRVVPLRDWSPHLVGVGNLWDQMSSTGDELATGTMDVIFVLILTCVMLIWVNVLAIYSGSDIMRSHDEQWRMAHPPKYDRDWTPVTVLFTRLVQVLNPARWGVLGRGSGAIRNDHIPSHSRS